MNQQTSFCREMTFLWVLNNAPGYAAWTALAGEEEPSSSSPNWANKMAMRLYLRQFEEGKELMEMKRKEHGAKGNICLFGNQNIIR